METLSHTPEKEAERFLSQALYATITEDKMHLILILKDLLPILEREYQDDVINDEYLMAHAGAGLTNHFLQEETSNSDFAYHLTCVLKKGIDELRHYTPKMQTQILSIAEKQTHQLVDKRADIQSRLPEFKALLQRLDDKTKLTYIALMELSCLEGINIDCFREALDKIVWPQGDELLQAAKNSSDEDSRLLYQLYEAGKEINQES